MDRIDAQKRNEKIGETFPDVIAAGMLSGISGGNEAIVNNVIYSSSNNVSLIYDKLYEYVRQAALLCKRSDYDRMKEIIERVKQVIDNFEKGKNEDDTTV